MDVCELFQLLQLGHEVGEDLCGVRIAVLRLEVVLQQDEVLVLDVGDDAARHDVHALRREEHDGEQDDDDGEVVADERLERPAVVDVVVVQLDVAGRVLQDLGRDVALRCDPDVARAVVQRHRPQQQDVQPRALQYPDLALLGQPRELVESLRELDDAQHRDAGLVDQLVQRRVDLFQVDERLEVDREREIVEVDELLYHLALLDCQQAFGVVHVDALGQHGELTERQQVIGLGQRVSRHGLRAARRVRLCGQRLRDDRVQGVDRQRRRHFYRRQCHTCDGVLLNRRIGYVNNLHVGYHLRLRRRRNHHRYVGVNLRRCSRNRHAHDSGDLRHDGSHNVRQTRERDGRRTVCSRTGVVGRMLRLVSLLSVVYHLLHSSLAFVFTCEVNRHITELFPFLYLNNALRTHQHQCAWWIISYRSIRRGRVRGRWRGTEREREGERGGDRGRERGRERGR